jgi:hypothetical protein
VTFRRRDLKEKFLKQFKWLSFHPSSVARLKIPIDRALIRLNYLKNLNRRSYYRRNLGRSNKSLLEINHSLIIKDSMLTLSPNIPNNMPSNKKPHNLFVQRLTGFSNTSLNLIFSFYDLI